jgi:glycosyltransferase involved in cell wall biosynthesis
MNPFLIIDTHPIQYRAPVFRELFKELSNLKVAYFSTSFNANHWWFREKNQNPNRDFGIDLLKGYPHEILELEKTSLFGKRKKLIEYCDRLKPCAILIYGYYLPEHWILRSYCEKNSVPLLFIGENFSPLSKSGIKSQLKSKLLDWFFKEVKAIVSIGKKNQDWYSQFKIKKEIIFPAKYCVENGFFIAPTSLQALKQTWRKKLGIPENAPTLLFVGRLFDRKRPFDFLKIHEKLSSLGYHSVLAGTGPFETELRKKQSSTFHVLGFQNQEQIKECYYGSDLLIVPSEFETWGLVVNEAAASGIPSLVTDKCGVAEDLVIQDKTGGIYPVGDIGKATEWIKNLTQEKMKSMGEKIRSKVTEEYSTNQMAEQILKAYTFAIGSSQHKTSASGSRR